MLLKRMSALTALYRPVFPAALVFLLIAAGLATLLEPETGRRLLLLPAVAITSLLGMTALPALRLSLPGLVLISLAVFLAYVLFSTLAFHPGILTLGMMQGIVLTGMTFGIALAAFAYSRPPPPPTYIVSSTLGVFTLLTAGQIIVSYYTGWGEVFETRDGIRRAYGMATDGISAPLAFLLLYHLLSSNRGLAFITILALFLSGGKMGLLLGTVSAFAAISCDLKTKRQIWPKILLLIAGIGCGLFMTDPRVNNYLFGTPTEQNLSSARYLTDSFGATGIGRLISWSAGAHMALTHPLRGIGYQQSHHEEVFQTHAQADLLDLKERMGITEQRIAAEQDISNQFLLIAAELGLPGLFLFLAFCAGCLLLAVRVLQQSGISRLATASAIWLILLITINQTAPWFMAGSTTLTLFAICLATCIAEYRAR